MSLTVGARLGPYEVTAPGLERGQLVPVRFFWLDPHTLCTGVALRAVNVDSVAGNGKSLQCLA